MQADALALLHVLATHLRQLLENGTILHPTSVVIEPDVRRAEALLARSKQEPGGHA